MQIVLQGFKGYGIKDWDGTVEVKPPLLYQYKRLANSHNQLSLFKKMLRVFSGTHSPLELPEGLAPAELGLNDFLQVLIGITAATRRGFQRTLKCPHCKAENPRVIDILSVFKPVAPVLPDGSAEVLLTVNNQPYRITCRPTTVKDYIDTANYVDALYAPAATDSLFVSQTIGRLVPKFGEFFDFNDAEDLEDFKVVLQEAALTAACLAFDGKELEDRIKWLLSLDGTAVDARRELTTMLENLSPTMLETHADTCSNCGKAFTASLEASEYFFVIP